MTTRARLLRVWTALAVSSLLLCGSGASGQTAFSEGFDGGGFVPPGWSVVSYNGGPVEWADNGASGENNWTEGAGSAAMVDSFAFPQQPYDAGLVTPTIPLPGGGNALELRFLTALEPWSGDETADVDISTDGGASWANLRRWNGLDSVSGTVVVPLGAYAGQSARFRFRYYNPDPGAWDVGWQIDEVVVAAGGGDPNDEDPNDGDPNSGGAILTAVSPADGETIPLDSSPTFRWSYTGPGSVSCRIQVATVEEDLGQRRKGLTFPARPVSGDTYALSVGEWRKLRTYLRRKYAGTFYWRVVADSDAGEIASSANRVGLQYGALTLQSPADNGTQSAYEAPTFTFDYAGTELTHFQVQVSTSADFARRARQITTRRSTETSRTLTAGEWRGIKRAFRGEPDPAKWVLYWRVIGSTANQKLRVATSPNRLTIDGGTITLVGPADGAAAALSGPSPTFTFTDSVAPWTGGRGGKYILQISKTADFARRETYEAPRLGGSAQELVVDARRWSRLGRVLRIDLSAGAGTVYWRVLGRDQDGLLKTPSAQVWTIELTE